VEQHNYYGVVACCGNLMDKDKEEEEVRKVTVSVYTCKNCGKKQHKVKVGECVHDKKPV
jgi:hypothetical protein